jgi:hypothetical protein
MTTSGDIAKVDTKIDLTKRESPKTVIPSFASYLTKKKNDNDIIDSNVEVTTVPMKVFNESFFCDIEATIRNNKVDIAEVQLYSKNSKFIKDISFFNESDCDYVFDGLKEYSGITKMGSKLRLII